MLLGRGVAVLRFARLFVQRSGDAGASQKLAQMRDVLPAQRAARMRAMQRAFSAVQSNVNAGSGQRLDVGAEVAQQRLYFPELDVAADRIVKDGAQEVV